MRLTDLKRKDMQSENTTILGCIQPLEELYAMGVSAILDDEEE